MHFNLNWLCDREDVPEQTWPESLEKIAPFAEHFFPVLQTTIWALLLGVLAYIFREQLFGIMSAVQERIEKGAPVNAGPFGLGALPPQSMATQKESIQKDVDEGGGDETQSEMTAPQNIDSPVSSGVDKDIRAQTVAQAYLAEDLVMRLLQAEYGVNIHRNIMIDRQTPFDGYFKYGNKGHLVEVKFFSRTKSAIARKVISDFIRKVSQIPKSRRQGFRSTLVIVLAEWDEKFVDMMKRDMAIDDVEIQFYSFEDLKSRFGIEA